jgi:dynein heavy chain 1
MGRKNLPLNKLPFNAIYTLLSECVYGGKMDNYNDHHRLDTFLRQLFSLQTFKADFKLVSDEHFLLSIPDAIKKKHFVDWIEDLKAAQTPSWLGLPNSAENALLTKNCNDIINKLLKLLIVDNDENYLI